MDRAAAVVQCDMVTSLEMTRRIPPPPSPPKQSVNIAIGRGSPPPGHDQVKWMVVDAAGERLHDDDLTFPEAWKLKEQLAGGRKVVSPRIEQAAAVEVLTPVGVPPGVPRQRPEVIAPLVDKLKEQLAGGWSEGISDAGGTPDWDSLRKPVVDDPPDEVEAAVRADEELEEMLKDMCVE